MDQWFWACPWASLRVRQFFFIFKPSACTSSHPYLHVPYLKISEQSVQSLLRTHPDKIRLGDLINFWGYILTRYNRLLWRQITVSTADADFGGERVGEDFLFDKFKRRIFWHLLEMEKMITVMRNCSSNLSLFYAQISFLSALQHLSFKKLHKNNFLLQLNV